MLKKTMPFIIITAAALLIISSLTIFTKAAPPQDLPETELQTQKQLVISYIESANSVSAQAEFDKLLTDFGSTEDIVPAVYDIGEKYRQFAKYKSSADAHWYILDNWPESEQAILAQRAVAVCSIGLGNIETAKIETQNLINNYIDDTNIAQAVFEIADAYYWFGKNPEAQQLYQQVIDIWPTAQHAMWAQMGLAISYIADGNDSAAQEATDKLVINYPDNEKLPEALFYIAGRYGWDKKYDKAFDYYRYIMNNFANTEWGQKALFESDRANIFMLLEAADEPNAISAIELNIRGYMTLTSPPQTAKKSKGLWQNLPRRIPQKARYVPLVTHT